MGEVCSIVDVNQFAEVGHSVDKCGFYGTSLLKFAGKPGASPSGNSNDIAMWADHEYVTYNGANVLANTNGMDMPTLFSVLHDAGLHWQVISSNELSYHPEHMTADYIRAWLRMGYPVILATAESAVYDQELGGSPYDWDTTGLYHVIVATGFDGDAILCHDTASIGPDGVRQGPRRYSANRLQQGLVSATAVVLPWLERPQGEFDPIASGGHMLPQGWHDNGTILTAPNNIPVKAGFRNYVLNYPGSWNAENWPLAPEQSLSETELAIHSGAGSRQIFRTLMLVWYAARGVAVAWTGSELFAYINLAAAQAKQIAELEAQLKAHSHP